MKKSLIKKNSPQEPIKIESKTLKDRLDEIDRKVILNCGNKYFQAQLGLFIGQWYKGRVVAESGVRVSASWREMERQTGHQRESLKKWHEIYKAQPDFEKLRPCSA